MVCRKTHVWLLVVQVLLALSATFALSGDDDASNNNDDQAEALLKFKESLQNSSQLDNWDKSIEMCNGSSSNWKGLVCLNGDLIMLQLEGLGLYGNIDVDSLAKLPNLRQFSVANNHFWGSVPNLSKLGGLRAVYLTNNRFSGEISDGSFVGLNSIRRVILASNQLTGRVPTSLAELPKLVDLQMQNNELEGEIPDLPQVNLTVNFANNKLEGSIPPHLRTQSSASFAGNSLCGPPLEACKRSSMSKKVKIIAIVLGVIGGVALLVILVAYCLIRRSGRKPSKYEKSKVANANLQKREAAHKANLNKLPRMPAESGGGFKYKKISNGNAVGGSKLLQFVRNNREKFELDDLLRASAEVLGSGSFGSSYKAELLNGSCMAVKRFRKMNNVGKEEFFEHMKRLGRLSHPNLLPLVAFYYAKEEKLLVYDFVELGSLASHLHGKRGPNQGALDWPTRLRIIKGVAKGLDYLYKELNSLVLPHGHLKSSNVLLDKKFEPILCDYALAPVMNREHAEQFMVAYKSPEFTQSDQVTRKTDVWSLGILILELLTGKFPANYLKQGKGGNAAGSAADLAGWVNSVVREEWTGEVFDKDMNIWRKRGEGQMLKLLKIGMCCCEWKVEKRWDLKEAIERIEELKEKDGGDEEYYYSSYGTSEEMHSSRAITDDDFSFSVAEKADV